MIRELKKTHKKNRFQRETANATPKKSAKQKFRENSSFASVISHDNLTPRYVEAQSRGAVGQSLPKLDKVFTLEGQNHIFDGQKKTS